MARTSLGKWAVITLALLAVPAWASAKTVYVAAGAAAGGDGSLEHPYPTITLALAQMSDGDTCLVRAGTYREELNLDQANITLAAYQDEAVTVSGCDLVKVDAGATYKIPLNGFECTRVKMDARVLQMFADGKRMDLARWPNKTQSMLSLKDWAPSTVDARQAKDAPKKDQTATLLWLPDKPDDYWKGGYYVGMNENGYPDHALSTWFSAGAEIASSQGKVLHLTKGAYGLGTTQANGNGYGFITNCLGALDTFGEWYWGDGYLYFKTPAGKPAQNFVVEARTRMNILHVQGDGIKISGINFVAGNALVKGNQADIEKCSFRYLSPFVANVASADQSESGARCNWGDYQTGSAGFTVLGNGMTMKECYLAHSWFSGMTIWGNSALVENCIVEDVNWLSKRCAGINSYGADVTIRYCTIRNMGAACLEGGNGNWLKKYAIRNIWEHNLLENVGLLGADGNGAFMYVNHQIGSNPQSDSQWRYNMCIKNRGPDNGLWGDMPSLYVDNNSSGYQVHHNVVIDAKTGGRYNDFLDGKTAGHDVYFYNNTFYNVNTWGIAYGLRPNTQADAGLVIENNLAIGGGGFGHMGGRKTFGPPNVSNADPSCVKDAAAGDFEPVDPKLIDAGKIIPGIQMEFAGSAPDIGAYESGQPKWTYGASMKVPDAFKNDELPAPGAVAE